MKKFFKISAAVLAVGMAVSLAGCRGSSVNLTVTNSNWFTGTSYKGIQPSFIAEDGYEDYIEDIDYKVEFDSSMAKNTSYSVNYKDGSFSTKFYAVRYDWKTNEKYPSSSEDEEVLYYYSNEMHISVQYTLKDGSKSEWFEDSVISESYFRAAGKSLQPVYSRQEIKSTSPNKSNPKKIQDAYKQIDVVYENYYNRNCTEATSVIKEAGKEQKQKVYSFKKVKNTLFDNTSLYIAVRSMKLSDTYSQTVSLFNAAAGGVSSYAINGYDSPLTETERSNITSELSQKGLYTPAEKDEGINTVAMNINYVGGNLIGTTQTVWYAAIDNPDNNTSRATMLKISIPLSYNLGTLNYTLQNVNSTLWNN